jgi:probable phosphoglycerate mutase
MKRDANSSSSRIAGLFHEQEPARPAGVYTANVDGAARGNPGPASYAVVVCAPDGSTQFRIGKYLGRATNNVAEYYALIGALDYAQSQHISHLAVRSDSELLVRQMQGRYKVKSPDLRPLHERAQKMARALAHFEIAHVRREHNSEADELANLALDAMGTVGGKTETAPSAELSGAAPVPVGAIASAAPAKVAAASAPMKNDRPIRARFSAGALHPLEALELAEGEIVEISVKKPAPR